MINEAKVVSRLCAPRRTSDQRRSASPACSSCRRLFSVAARVLPRAPVRRSTATHSSPSPMRAEASLTSAVLRASRTTASSIPAGRSDRTVVAIGAVARSSGLRQRHQERGHKWLSTETTLNRLQFDSCGREIFRIERDDNADRAATPEWNDHAIADRSVGSVESEIVIEPLARRTWHIDRDAQDRSRRQRVRLSASRHTEIRRSGCFARSARTIFST